MMQVARFTNGGFVVHKLYLDGMASKFSAWVGKYGNLQDAERIDARGRAYPVTRNSKAWARLDGRCQIIAAQLERNGPTPVARSSAAADHGMPWAP